MGTSERKIHHKVIIITKDKSVRCSCFHAQASVSCTALKGSKGHSVGRNTRCLLPLRAWHAHPLPQPWITGLPCFLSALASPSQFHPVSSLVLLNTKALQILVWVSPPHSTRHCAPGPGLPGSSAVVARRRKFAIKYLAWQKGSPFRLSRWPWSQRPSQHSVYSLLSFSDLLLLWNDFFPPATSSMFVIQGPFVMKLFKI